MIQVDLPAAFAVGQVFAFLSKDYLKKTPEKITHKLIGPLNMYFIGGFVPTGMYLMIGWPSWEAMYVTDWFEKTFDNPWVASFYVAFMVSMVILGNFGYILAHNWYLKGKDKYVLWGVTAGFVLTLLPFVLRWGVWFKVGTFANIQNNMGYSFFEMPFFGGWLFYMAYMFVVTVSVGTWFKRKGNVMEVT